MQGLRACIVCLAVDVKLYSMNENQTKQQYYLLTGLQIKHTNGLPEYLCFECISYLERFIKFRDKCLRTHFALQELLQRSTEINKVTLRAVNRNAIGINPFLTVVELDNISYEPATEIDRSFCVINDISTCNSKETVPTESINFNEQNIKTENCFISFEETICDKSTSPYHNNDDDNNDNDYINDNNYNNDNSNRLDSDVKVINDIHKNNAEVSDSREEDASATEFYFATSYLITKNEAKAVNEIKKMLCLGSEFNCEICSKPHFSKTRLDIHKRMHDRHSNGDFWCDLCNYYYKSEFLLKVHVRDKHMYKYVCKKCPEVSFDRSSARLHYNVAHKVKPINKSTEDNNINTRKRAKRAEAVLPIPKKKKKKKIRMFMGLIEYTPVEQDEQYRIIQERKKSRNYKESAFKCEMCFRGFTNQDTFDKHLKKHDPKISGMHRCDMCKMCRKTKRRMYAHMKGTHLSRYTCTVCKPSIVCYSRSQAHNHVRWHQKVTYDCPHCDQKFNKISSKLTHMRVFHPTTILCSLCGHSFVSKTGLGFHKLKTHTEEERELASKATVDKSDPLYCAECDMQFHSQQAFDTHLRSSSKHSKRNSSVDDVLSLRAKERRKGNALKSSTPRLPGERKPRTERVGVLNCRNATNCEICDKPLRSEYLEFKHYAAAHPGYEPPKRYMCDICGHKTKRYECLTVHMRTHTQEKPFKCPHCDRCFSMQSNRDRHLVTHTGVKKHECPQCHRRFTQKFDVKLHIQTVHLKIPYAPWNKKLRKQRKEMMNKLKSTSEEMTNAMKSTSKEMTNVMKSTSALAAATAEAVGETPLPPLDTVDFLDTLSHGHQYMEESLEYDPPC